MNRKSQHMENQTEQQSVRKRLEAVEKHPEYPALLNVKPGAASLYGRFGCFVIFGLIFAFVALFMSSAVPKAIEGFGPTGLVRILLLVFTAVGAGVTVWGIFGVLKLSGSRLRRLPALVVDKRLKVRGGGQSTSAYTYYYVTLEFGDGERREFEARGKMYGKIAKNDAGVAYIRNRYLLDYRRLG